MTIFSQYYKGSIVWLHLLDESVLFIHKLAKSCVEEKSLLKDKINLNF